MFVIVNIKLLKYIVLLKDKILYVDFYRVYLLIFSLRYLKIKRLSKYFFRIIDKVIKKVLLRLEREEFLNN